ncbi:hypothetical protein BWK57_13560 [Flavobacterium columnare]|uniref:hypothetical protein n=1 Tax=Flavobacterium columnare TaxID=996 RepID=UPI000CDAE35F|nr:hypothetical protein [Flavobacterium columnare]POR19417.1 hypothetical protein BWK57_13560 [Flavobacterium columnare]
MKKFQLFTADAVISESSLCLISQNSKKKKLLKKAHIDSKNFNERLTKEQFDELKKRGFTTGRIENYIIKQILI